MLLHVILKDIYQYQTLADTSRHLLRLSTAMHRMEQYKYYNFERYEGEYTKLLTFGCSQHETNIYISNNSVLTFHCSLQTTKQASCKIRCQRG